jgi:DNA-binding response OmpR family regulator
MAETRPLILYVDDDPDYRDAVRAILEANGYAMLEADSAEEGLAVFLERRPDLVLVDLMMEEIDAGTALVRDIRAAGGSVPIYMMSSVGDDIRATVDLDSLGLAGVFQKPVDSAALLRVLGARARA